MAGNHHRFRLLTLVLVLMLASATAAVGWTYANGVNYNTDKETLNKDAEGYRPYAVDILYHADGAYHPAGGEQGSAAFSNAWWCPNRTEIVYLQVVNHEKFPVDVMPGLLIESNSFGKVMSFSAIRGDLTARDENHPTSWEDFCDKGTEAVVIGTPTLIKPATHTLFEDLTSLYPGQSLYFALAIHMDKDATSDYAKAAMELKFTVQVNADHQPGYDPADPSAT